MAFSWNRFAYTNFHELNLDWFNEHFKEIFEEWEELYNTLTQWKDDTDADLAQWKSDTLQEMEQWENDLLDALNQWKSDTGEDIGEWEAGVISDLNDWKDDFNTAYEAMYDRVDAIVSDTEDMVENLAEPFSATTPYSKGDYVVYNGILYIFTNDHAAGAWDVSDVQQTTAMDDIQDLRYNVDDYIVSQITPNLHDTLNGLGFYKDTIDTVKFYGSATANRRILFLNGQKTVKAAADAFERTLPAGKYKISLSSSGAQTLGWSGFVINYSYTTFSGGETLASADGNYEIEFTSPVMIGISVSTGINYGTESNPSYLTIVIKRETAVDEIARAELGQGLKATGDSTDRTGDINALLARYKNVKLGEGEFYVTRLDIPENGCLCGSGAGTVIVKISTDAVNVPTIFANSKATIKDLTVKGTLTEQPDADTVYDRNRIGIAVEGVVEPVIIENCRIIGFTYSGINIKDTGTSVKSVIINNCEIKWCRMGINISASEYVCATNVICRDNYIGCNNAGGNNKFVCCGFDSNGWGFIVADTTNDGHGSCVGCSFNHNTNRSIAAQSVDYGFVFDGCQIHYGMIRVDVNSKGIVFTGCEFGGDVVIYQVSTTYPIIFNSGIFYQDVRTVVGYTVGNIIYNNCYLFDGTEITA